MALFKYFSRKDDHDTTVDTVDIQEAPAERQVSSSSDSKKQRGSYQKFTQKEKAEIAKYASENGVARAVRHFKEKKVKKSSVVDWRKAYERELKAKVSNSKPGEAIVVEELFEKRRGRPPRLSVKLDNQLQSKIIAMRSQQAIINSNIVISIARALIKKNKMLLAEFGEPITLDKDWARNVLRRMRFSKRRGTSTSKVVPSEFEAIKSNYLVDIYTVVKIENIPDYLIINWDQTGMKIVPTANWTMEKKGSTRVEIAATDDKRQVTFVFAASLAGHFLPPQIIYKGKTLKCLPNNVDFPKDWHLTFSENHWSNEKSMKEYVNSIILPYVSNKRREHGLDESHPALVIFDYFKGQCQPSIFQLLTDNNIFYILVPPNCTDRLQPLDLSVNKPAKDFMKRKFQEWYANIIFQQLESGVEEPVDMRLSLIKPLVSQWSVELYHYLSSRPDILINGFRSAGILDVLQL